MKTPGYPFTVHGKTDHSYFSATVESNYVYFIIFIPFELHV